ncbi:hypothetical protein BLNAU_8574 [Blattamonas nauphoetae]|uniref:Uncharacterized protein n=1 Tax=Blattamonas nauphoetae TaxID=2049346 RepID=A0ABQ9XYE7_9EUKA|nr:hypothetical protein BLNAU_8574 [Blattamonas nauphoetae]
MIDSALERTLSTGKHRNLRRMKRRTHPSLLPSQSSLSRPYLEAKGANTPNCPLLQLPCSTHEEGLEHPTTTNMIVTDSSQTSKLQQACPEQLVIVVDGFVGQGVIASSTDVVSQYFLLYDDSLHIPNSHTWSGLRSEDQGQMMRAAAVMAFMSTGTPPLSHKSYGDATLTNSPIKDCVGKNQNGHHQKEYLFDTYLADGGVGGAASLWILEIGKSNERMNRMIELWAPKAIE